MTKISMIRGASAPFAADKPESKDVIPLPFINYSAMTSGELSAVLTKERAKLLLSERPDSPLASDWQKGITMIDNFLYKGVHNAGVSITGLFGSAELDKFAAVLSKAKKRSEPASFEFLAVDRKIGDPLIPIDQNQCRVYFEGGYGQRPDPVRAAQCQFQVEMMNLLNDPRRGLAEHAIYSLLYEFIGASKFLEVNARNPQTGFKIDRHKMVIPEIQHWSGLQAYNVRNWAELGIRRKCAGQISLGPLNPLEVIAILEAFPTAGLHDGNAVYDINGNRIGFLDPFTLVALALVIFVAFAALGGFVQILQGKEPTAFDRVTGILVPALHAAKGADFGELGGSLLGDSQSACPAGQVRDAATQQCKPILQSGCNPGYIKDAAGNCIAEPTDDPVQASAGNKNMIIAAAAAAGLYFLAK